MVKDFLHGPEARTAPVTQPAADVDLSTIGIIGIAPYADPEKWPVDTPVLVSGADTQLIGALTANAPDDAIDTGTLPAAFASMLDECSPIIVAIRVEGKTSYDPGTLPSIIGGIDKNGAYTGVHGFLSAESLTGYRPRLLCAPGYTHQTSKGAVTGITIASSGSAYMPGEYGLMITDATGTGAKATATIGNDGTVTGVTVTANGSGYSKPTASLPADAGSGSGARFSLNIADISNAVVAELKGIAERLRAVVFADGPNTNFTDAVAAAQEGGDRVLLIDPWIVREINGISQAVPPSAKFAAKQAWVDRNLGFWRSVSNQALNGLTSLSRPIDFVIGDESSAANMLNARNIATIIRRAGTGFVTWGNRALDGSFLCVTRMVDEVNDALLQASMQFVDEGITANYVTAVTQEVNAYLRQLQARGAITGGKCWADKSLNTPNEIKNGHISFNFDLGAVYPAERITFTSTINDDYVTTIFGGNS